MIGKTLSHYTILEKIGAGGMGEVYVAEDTKLSRKVALKVLPPEMAENAERRARFEREAKAVAALDHPNIVTIYSVEEAEGVHFYTMQLVKGKTLSELIPKKGMPLNKFFDVAIPLADAVSAAHEQGIIHRDLKPDNLMVSDDGRLKILDFGLAKLKPAFAEEGASELPTQSATAEGRILGTVAYMSPEQAEGKQIDNRSDIFSIGIILYEMATGERPFKGDTAASLLSSILRDKPQSANEVNATLPRDLGKIIRRCLAKNPDDRIQAAKDLRNELRELKQEVDSGEVSDSTVIASPAQAKKWPIIAALMAVVVLAATVIYLLIKSPVEKEPSSVAPTAGTFTQLTTQVGQELFPSLSPDAKFIAYASKASGNWDIYLLRIGGQRAINLTEDSPANDTQPAFSPDGEQIAFRSERDGGGIYVMGATGESVKRLTDFGFTPDWSPNGDTILCAPENVVDFTSANRPGQLWAVSVSTAEKRLVFEGFVNHPSWSPNGHRIAYWAWDGGITDIWTISSDGGEPIPVTNSQSIDRGPIWSPSDSHIYFSSNRGGNTNVWKVPIDEETGTVLDEPISVTLGTGASSVHLTVTSDGRHIAYSSYSRVKHIERISFDPAAESVIGKPVSVTPRGAVHPSVSPDGQWLAFDRTFGKAGTVDIGVIRTDGTGLRQLTDTPYRNRFPRWSPDGERIVFGSGRSGELELWTINRDGSHLVGPLTDTPGRTTSIGVWSPDGSKLATDEPQACVFSADTPWTVEPPGMLPPIDEDRDLIFLPYSWSSDGKMLAGSLFALTGKHHLGIYIYFLETKVYKKLTDFGGFPSWLKDNRRLLFTASPESSANVSIFLLDCITGDTHEILSRDMLNIAPDTIGSWPNISPDSRSIFFERYYAEADIWMLTLNEERE